MHIAGSNFTNFENVRVKGTDSRAGAIRIVGTSALEGSMSVNTTYFDKNVQWTLPAKSGGIPIMGTFSVDLPAINTTTTIFSTAVTVSGIRAEDALVVFPNVTGATDSTARILMGAVPSTNTVTLYFSNIGSAAYGLYGKTYSYCAYR